MKKVIISKENSSFIDVNSVTNEDIVGMEWRSGHRSLIIELEFNSYVGLSKDTIIDSWSKPSKKEYILEANRQEAQAFVFDNYSDAYKWLSESERYL